MYIFASVTYPLDIFPSVYYFCSNLWFLCLLFYFPNIEVATLVILFD